MRTLAKDPLLDPKNWFPGMAVPSPREIRADEIYSKCLAQALPAGMDLPRNLDDRRAALGVARARQVGLKQRAMREYEDVRVGVTPWGPMYELVPVLDKRGEQVRDEKGRVVRRQVPGRVRRLMADRYGRIKRAKGSIQAIDRALLALTPREQANFLKMTPAEQVKAGGEA